MGSIYNLSPPRGAILSVRNLSVFYPRKTKLFQRKVVFSQVLYGVDLDLFAGKVVALVGESGSGKSTLGEAIAGLLPNVRGDFYFRGTAYNPGRMGSLRKKIQIIFQDPLSALHPRLTIGQTLTEVLKQHRSVSLSVSELLDEVQLPSQAAGKYPHELSGGQCQRACIARALAVEPEVLICDEITSSLDVSIQAKILNLMNRIIQQHGVALLFMTHDLHTVHAFADRVLVMHEGRIVEGGDVDQVFYHPRQPYTQSLIAAIPGISGISGI